MEKHNFIAESEDCLITNITLSCIEKIFICNCVILIVLQTEQCREKCYTFVIYVITVYISSVTLFLQYDYTLSAFH